MRYTMIILMFLCSCKRKIPKGDAAFNAPKLDKNSYEVVENYKGGFNLAHEEIITIFDYVHLSRISKEPRAALLLEFLTSGKRVVWCGITPTGDDELLNKVYLSRPMKTNIDNIQIISIRMQIVNEESMLNRESISDRSIVLLENAEYYCAYVDMDGNKYISKFKVPKLTADSYYKYLIKGKMVGNLKLYNKRLKPIIYD